MSKGNTLRVLILFTLPMILSVSFQQLYNIADSVIAGNMLGKDALAAVSASYPITMIFMAVGTGLSVGCSVVTSRIYGEKDYNKLKSAVSVILFQSRFSGLCQPPKKYLRIQLNTCKYICSGLFLYFCIIHAAQPFRLWVIPIRRCFFLFFPQYLT